LSRRSSSSSGAVARGRRGRLQRVLPEEREAPRRAASASPRQSAGAKRRWCCAPGAAGSGAAARAATVFLTAKASQLRCSHFTTRTALESQRKSKRKKKRKERKEGRKSNIKKANVQRLLNNTAMLRVVCSSGSVSSLHARCCG